MSAPEISEHDGIVVVRDDLYAGGTKARFLPALFADADELVYASPCEGGAQTALATIAAALGKRATIFVAKRGKPHPRTLAAKALGAKVLQIEPGYLSVVQARARAYAAHVGAKLLPFGLDVPQAQEAISAAAKAIGIAPQEVWCAAGSGVLARALQETWPRARLNAVQVGKDVDLPGAKLWKYPLAFGQQGRVRPPFPSDPHYDSKAWELCCMHRAGPALFWNVTGNV